MKVAKINATIAQALAEQIVSDLHEIKSKQSKDALSKVKSDPLIDKANRLHKEKEKISREIGAIEEQLRKKYKARSVDFNYGHVRVTFSENGVPPASVVKSDIIIANQVEGVEYADMKKHIIKKWS